MKKELDNQLCKKYPNLYRDRHGRPDHTLMCWGFACHDGWYTLIDVLSELLTKHSAETNATQVKEKFGGLRFYLNSHDDYTIALTTMAEKLSFHICEICGAPGSSRNIEGWSSTRCEEHAEGYPGHDDPVVVIDVALGAAWSRLIAILKNSADWYAKQNDLSKVDFKVSKDNGQLKITWPGDNLRIIGMVDMIEHYANRIDAHSGQIHALKNNDQA